MKVLEAVIAQLFTCAGCPTCDSCTGGIAPGVAFVRLIVLGASLMGDAPQVKQSWTACGLSCVAGLLKRHGLELAQLRAPGDSPRVHLPAEMALVQQLADVHGSLGQMTAHRDALLRALEHAQDALTQLRGPAP